MNRKLSPQVIVLIMACLLMCLAMFHKIAPSVLSLDLTRDLDLSPVQLGAVGSMTMLGFGLMQLPGGLLVDRLSGRKTLAGLSLITGLGTLIFALAPTPAPAIASRFLVGIGLAVTVPCLAVLAQWFSPSTFGRANSIFLAAAGLGSLLASSPLALASQVFGWRTVLLSISGISFIMAILLMRLIPAKPPKVDEISQKNAEQPKIIPTIKVVLQTRNFWHLAGFMGFMGGLFMSFNTLWWGPYLMQGNGLSQVTAGNILAVIQMCGLLLTPCLALVYDKLIPNRKRLLLLCSCLALAVIILMRKVCGTQNPALHIALGLVFATAGGNIVTVLYSSIREIFPVSMAGTALGCFNTVMPICCVTIQQVFGYLIQIQKNAEFPLAMSEAYANAMWLPIILAILAVFSILTMPGHQPRPR